MRVCAWRSGVVSHTLVGSIIHWVRKYGPEHCIQNKDRSCCWASCPPSSPSYPRRRRGECECWHSDWLHRRWSRGCCWSRIFRLICARCLFLRADRMPGCVWDVACWACRSLSRSQRYHFPRALPSSRSWCGRRRHSTNRPLVSDPE